MAARQATPPVVVESVATGNESLWGRRGLPPLEVGKGFDPTTTKQGPGLTNMADRLDALGGSIAVTSSIGAGTRVLGHVPMHAAVVAG